MRKSPQIQGSFIICFSLTDIVVHTELLSGEKNRTLRAASTLAFSKFLCVSSQFCDQHHRLLFKILETSKDASIRSNTVIALGDVAVSFSSIIDENSNELYKGLSDKDLVVKKNTLMVLTHLILNGMIKVKGQLGEMAKCLEDTDERIADLAKLFFSELATKENAIYNNLPDGMFTHIPTVICQSIWFVLVISHLSVGAHAVDEEVFQSTMRYIFSFIEKVSPRFFVRLLLTSFVTPRIIGKTSRKYRRKTLSTFPPIRRPQTMARYRILSLPPPFQIRTIRQETHRRASILSRQAT